jgi:hypothetical protein
MPQRTTSRTFSLGLQGLINALLSVNEQLVGDGLRLRVKGCGLLVPGRWLLLAGFAGRCLGLVTPYLQSPRWLRPRTPNFESWLSIEIERESGGVKERRQVKEG